MDLSFDPEENILFVSHSRPIHLESEQQIQEYFDTVVAFWRAKCKSKRVYFVIQYDGLTVDPNLKDAYAKQVGRGVRDCAIAIVRYGGDHLQRTVARLVGIHLHVPSNVYRSRAEAISVVRALRAKDSL